MQYRFGRRHPTCRSNRRLGVCRKFIVLQNGGREVNKATYREVLGVI